MLLSLPSFTAFRFYFPKSWFSEAVNDRYIGVIRDSILPFESIADYVNSTITNAVIPGIVDQGSTPQYNRIGNSLQYKGSLPHTETIDREIVLTMTLKGSYMNWVIMYIQLLEYLSWDNRDTTFMPDVFCQILDHDENVIIEMIYKQVRLMSISSVDLSTMENSIVNKNFDFKLGYADVEISTKIENRFL